MKPQDSPSCPRHDFDVTMTLRSLHTDVSRPGQLVGTYECPDCGEERRYPVQEVA